MKSCAAGLESEPGNAGDGIGRCNGVQSNYTFWAIVYDMVCSVKAIFWMPFQSPMV